MRVIRSAGQNVSPSDDGRLYDQIFTDGLFEDVTITHLGTNNVALGAMYGIICGRDFTAEAQTVAVELPEDDTGTTGYIYIEIDTSSDDVITIGSSLAPFTPTYEDINTNGAVAQMIIAEYVANSVAITSITPVYPTATSGDVLPGSMATVESAQAVSNHSVGEYVLLNGQLYKVISAITAGQTLTPGTNIQATSVGAQLNALNNDLSFKDFTFTPVSGISVTYDVFVSNNKLAIISADFYNLNGGITVPTSTWVKLGDVSVRPLSEARRVIVNNAGKALIAFIFSVTNMGEVRIFQTSGASVNATELYLNIEYKIA